MKLFKPKEIEKEVMIAINYYSKTSPQLVALSNEVLVFIQKEILEYIKNNTEIK